jgi:hypothetical protein
MLSLSCSKLALCHKWMYGSTLSWIWVISFMSLLLYPQRTSPWDPWDRRLCEPKSWSGQCVRSEHWDLNCNPSCYTDWLPCAVRWDNMGDNQSESVQRLSASECWFLPCEYPNDWGKLSDDQTACPKANTMFEFRHYVAHEDILCNVMFVCEYNVELKRVADTLDTR